MRLIRDMLQTRIIVLTALGLTLMWGSSVTVATLAQDDHAGHDHSENWEEDRESPEVGLAEDEHDDHAGEDHAGEDHAATLAQDDHAGHDHSENWEEDHESPEVGLTEDEHDDHAGHDHGAEVEDNGADGDDQGTHEDEALRLTEEQHKRFGITVQSAGAGSLRSEVRLPGEIVFNEDRVVHMVPRVAGIAREVLKSVGNPVEAGEILAVIESRELADAKSGYLAAKARRALAEKNFSREKTLREKQISSEQDYLEAEQAFEEARIQLRSAEQKLHALGLDESAVGALGVAHNEAITHYELRSPLGGVVTMKHIALGESLKADTDVFTVADARSVWVNLTVYTKDLGAVRAGQDVVLRADYSGAQAQGKIAMVTPFVEESTRSATARVILDNSDGQWMPGTFVTGFISVSEEDLPVVVPRQAVQNIDGRDVVFVEHEGGFEMTRVTTGRSDRDSVEVVAGLEPGTPYVADGAFQLKATVITSALGSHAGHGH